ncbi:MAG: hypothetical protein ATN31_09690 [Candidatus Epulonipiscioides saccharophilum]|nr:MAG: hypothetical protein ATN31_09690 [Epulopiscium sp. AS2M-Bin001]
MVVIDIHDKKPIYMQLVDGIKEQVLKGFLKPGDKIYSIRQLASELSINPNTVSRAYAELERQKIIVSARGRGNFINENLSFEKDEVKREELANVLSKFCVEWNFAGYNQEELHELIIDIYKTI